MGMYSNDYDICPKCKGLGHSFGQTKTWEHEFYCDNEECGYCWREIGIIDRKKEKETGLRYFKVFKDGKFKTRIYEKWLSRPCQNWTPICMKLNKKATSISEGVR